MEVALLAVCACTQSPPVTFSGKLLADPFHGESQTWLQRERQPTFATLAHRAEVAAVGGVHDAPTQLRVRGRERDEAGRVAQHQQRPRILAALAASGRLGAEAAEATAEWGLKGQTRRRWHFRAGPIEQPQAVGCTLLSPWWPPQPWPHQPPRRPL